MKRLGILSGTFNPVHIGHIEFSLAALKKCRLDEVWLLPEKLPRHKIGISSFRHRLAMLELAVRNCPQIKIKLLEEDNFTIRQTLPELLDLADGAELWLLIGSDYLKGNFKDWPGLDELASKVKFAIGLRAGDTTEITRSLIKEIENDLRLRIDCKIIKSPKPHFSSSKIRAKKLRLDNLDPEVANYISANKLYA